MKYILLILLLILSACRQSQAPAFSERVANAEALENTLAGALFIGALLKEHGESINNFIGQCYADSVLDKDSFTVVADIDKAGNFKNVVVQTESTPSLCYADKLAKLHTNVSRPVGFSAKSIPFVINVNYNK